MSALTPFMFADGKGSPPNARTKSRVPWLYAVACCGYYLFVYRALAAVTPGFAKLHQGLGVAIPLATRLVMTGYRWTSAVLFLGAVVLTIVKQFVPFEKWRLDAANLTLIFVGVVYPLLVLLAWYLPLWVLIWRLGHAS